MESDYPTCSQTHADLRIYSDKLVPDEISTLLGLQPTRCLAKGDRLGPTMPPVKRTVWKLSSEGTVQSRDLRRHLDWLFDQLLRVPEGALKHIATTGEVRIWVSWWSASGHGGPILGVSQLTALARLGLELHFDIYFPEDDPPDE